MKQGALIYLLILISPFSLIASEEPQECLSKPNILLVLIDDCSAEEIGCYGNSENKTPVLDNLAIKGARFETFWSAPICSPSRALIMTGRYGFRTGWYHNHMRKNIPLPEENLIFSQPLQEAGYRTAVAGKWQLPGMPPEYGFDEHCLWAYENYLPDGIKHEGYDSLNPEAYNFKYMARYWHPSILKNGEYFPTTNDVYGPDVHSDFLVNFMTESTDKPFFAYYSMVLTHDPFYPTPDTVEGDEGKLGPTDMEKNFKGYVEYVDKLVGKIISALEASGQLENTAIVVTADNGTTTRGKGRAQEIGVRVPLIVWWPGMIENMGVMRELAEFSDIFPTLMDIAGVEIPDDYVHDGRSFLPLLTGKSYQEREYVFSYLGTKRLVRDKRWLLEGDGTFYDCMEYRSPRGYQDYKDVTESTDPVVLAAMARLEKFLEDKPAPNPKK